MNATVDPPSMAVEMQGREEQLNRTLLRRSTLLIGRFIILPISPTVNTSSAECSHIYTTSGKATKWTVRLRSPHISSGASVYLENYWLRHHWVSEMFGSRNSPPPVNFVVPSLIVPGRSLLFSMPSLACWEQYSDFLLPLSTPYVGCFVQPWREHLLFYP